MGRKPHLNHASEEIAKTTASKGKGIRARVKPQACANPTAWDFLGADGSYAGKRLACIINQAHSGNKKQHERACFAHFRVRDFWNRKADIRICMEALLNACLYCTCID